MFDFQRLRSGGNLFVFIGGVLLAVVLFMLVTIVFFGQAQLKEVALQRAVSELEKQASALDYFIAEQKDAVRELTNDHAIKTYLANQALGMSMEYGLRASLLQVVDRLRSLKKRKDVHGNPIFHRLVFFDQHGRTLADETAVLPEGGVWEGAVPFPTTNVTLLFTRGVECPNACLVAPVVFKSRMLGFLVADMDMQSALDTLLTSHLHGQDHRLTLRTTDGLVLYSSELTPSINKDESPLIVAVSGANLVLESTFRLEDAEGYFSPRGCRGPSRY